MLRAWLFVFAAIAALAAPARGQEIAPTQPAPPAPSVPAAISPTAGLVAARVTTTPERARLILDLTEPTEFAIVSLSAPDRIAVDVRVGTSTVDGQLMPAGQGLVVSAETSLLEADRARTELTLAGPALVQQAYVLEAFDDQPARLIVDLIPDTEAAFASRVAADLAASHAHAGDTGEIPLDHESTPPGTSAVAAVSRPLVVIDPGHGGIDSGAEAGNGVKEKNIVLAFSLKLQQLLVAAGRFDVALTRDDDTFLRLEDRVNIARQNKADLFISIHADSFQQHDVRGASVYTRDERATDILDKVLADGENTADIVAGFTPVDAPLAVVDILVDLMRREMRRQSYVAAQSIVEQLEPSVTMRRFPVRQADFFVLQAPDVPSLLVELGFLSNATDAGNLLTGEWQQRTAEALARGINAYFDSIAEP